MNLVKFQYKEYKMREIELPELGCVLISTISLNNALMNNRSDYVSNEAKNIDEEIYFFVEEEEIEMNEVNLVKLISQLIV